MKNKIIFVVGMLVMVLVLIYVVSLTNTNQAPTEGVKSKEAPQAYVNKDKPTAIYIEGNPEPVLRIEDLPKEFPPHIHHMEGAKPRDGSMFNLAVLSPNGQKIAFSCGGGNEWVGVYTMSNKKIDAIDWFFHTHIKQILWAPNSKYLTFTFLGANGASYVIIVAFKEKTEEPYISNSWSSGIDTFAVTDIIFQLNDLRWSIDSENIEFVIQKFKPKNNEIVKVENEPAKTVTLKAVKEKEEDKYELRQDSTEDKLEIHIPEDKLEPLRDSTEDKLEIQ